MVSSGSGARRGVTRSLVGLVLAAAGLRSISSAWAEDGPSARLVYDVKPPAGSCPDLAALSDQVAGRLGYVPFREDARQTVRVVVDRVGDQLRARVELSGEREQPWAQGPCLVILVEMADDLEEHS